MNKPLMKPHKRKVDRDTTNMKHTKAEKDALALRWERVDKDGGAVSPVTAERAIDVAREFYRDAALALETAMSGTAPLETPFALYRPSTTTTVSDLG